MILDTYDEDCYKVNYSPSAPLDIVSGYGGALFGEAKKQMLEQQNNSSTPCCNNSTTPKVNRLVLQAGVGSFASSGLMYVHYERENAKKLGKESLLEFLIQLN